MGRQDTENLFRRYKGQVVTIRANSGAVYKGTITEISNDYAVISNLETEKATFVLFAAIESVVVEDAPTSSP